jgi:hypothetical protein
MSMGEEKEKGFFDKVDYGTPEANLFMWLLLSIKRLFTNLSKTK